MIRLYFDSVSLEMVDGVVCKLTIEHWEDFGCYIVDRDFDKRDQSWV